MALDDKIAALSTSIRDCTQRYKVGANDATDLLSEFSGPADSTLVMKGGRIIDGFSRQEICKTQYFVRTDAELNQAMSQSEDFTEVFNTWKRISHMSTTPVQPANVEDLLSWEMNGDKIRSTVNSSSMMGFVSPDKFTDFTFTANVSSTSNDDDYIGLIAAYAEVDGQQHTLSVIRSGGSGKLWFCIKNFSQGIPRGQKQVFYGNFGLRYPDGVVDDTRPNAPTNNAYGSWVTVPRGCRIQVVRSGDVFTFRTTNYILDDNEPTWHAPATQTLDLNSDPAYAMFKGSSQIGYMCQSQANSTYDTFSRPASMKDIVDVRNNDVWRFKNNTWVNIGKLNTVDDFTFGTFYFSPINAGLFYVDYDRVLYETK